MRVNHYDNQYDSDYGAPVDIEGDAPASGRGRDRYRVPRQRLKEIHAVIEQH